MHVIEGLRAAGHDVHVLTTPADGADPSVHAIGDSTGGRYSLRFFRELKREAVRLCNEHDIDVIHAQGFAGIPLTFAQRRLPPVVTTVHGTLWSETPLDRRVRRTRSAGEGIADLWRFKHRFAFAPLWHLWLASRPQIVCDSRFTAKELKRIRRSLRPVVVPLGFETAPFLAGARMAFDPGTRSLTERTATSPPFVLAIGRIERIKGFDFLLRVARALRNSGDAGFQFVIGGEGPERSRLVRKIDAMGLTDRVHCVGRIGDDELAKWYRAADVFANADGGHPAFGLANAEALAAGTPVVATPNGAHGDVVSHGDDGKLIEARDPARWAAAIRRIAAADSRDADRRRRRASRAAGRFSRDRMIARLEKVLRRAAGGETTLSR